MPIRQIIIETMPREEMRPPYDRGEEGAGDWFYRDGALRVRVAGLGTDIMAPEAFLFAFHELVEAMLCRHEGVSQEAVDVFDTNYTGEGEPGDAEESPYRSQHRRAMLVEHLMANWLGVSAYGKVE